MNCLKSGLEFGARVGGGNWDAQEVPYGHAAVADGSPGEVPLWLAGGQMGGIEDRLQFGGGGW